MRDAWAEGRCVVLEHRERVAVGIDGDEEHAHFSRLVAERIQNKINIGKGQRANIGAERVPKIKQDHLSLEIVRHHRLAIVGTRQDEI